MCSNPEFLNRRTSTPLRNGELSLSTGTEAALVAVNHNSPSLQRSQTRRNLVVTYKRFPARDAYGNQFDKEVLEVLSLDAERGSVFVKSINTNRTRKARLQECKPIDGWLYMATKTNNKEGQLRLTVGNFYCIQSINEDRAMFNGYCVLTKETGLIHTV